MWVASLGGGSYGVWGGYVPNSLTNPKVFRIAEQYLIAAEAASMLGKKSDALRYLNTLRSSITLAAILECYKLEADCGNT